MFTGQLRRHGTWLGSQAHDAIRKLLRSGDNDEAISQLKSIIAGKAKDLTARELMFDAHFQRRDWSSALIEIEYLCQLQPNKNSHQRKFISTLSNMGRYEQVVTKGKQYLAQHGDDVRVLNNLKVSYFNLGNLAEAVSCGQRGLELRDAECWLNATATQLGPPEGRTGKSVISFSLWGGNAVYNYGALINSKLARSVYPAWVCRFYVGADVPQETIDQLLSSGSEVVSFAELPEVPGLFARFLPMSDPLVEKFIVRDCDSRLSTVESDLVAVWGASNRPFHVIRDHVLHNEPIMGGLWGGRADCGVDILALMRNYFSRGASSKYGHDQSMLGAKLWPLIRNNCLVHDRFYRLAGVMTQPLSAKGPHLGAGYQNPARVRQEIIRWGIAPIGELDDGPVWR